MIHDFMWAHPDLFTWLLCIGCVSIAVGIMKICYGLRGKDDE